MTAKTAMDLVSEAKGRIESLDVDEVQAEIESGDAVLVDLREPPELEEGILPGAIVAPRGMLEFYADPQSSYHRPELDPKKRTILYCGSRGRSAMATDRLQELGYQDVAHLDGGFKAWRDAGCEVEEYA